MTKNIVRVKKISGILVSVVLISLRMYLLLLPLSKLEIIQKSHEKHHILLPVIWLKKCHLIKNLQFCGPLVWLEIALTSTKYFFYLALTWLENVLTFQQKYLVEAINEYMNQTFTFSHKASVHMMSTVGESRTNTDADLQSLLSDLRGCSHGLSQSVTNFSDYSDITWWE